MKYTTFCAELLDRYEQTLGWNLHARKPLTDGEHTTADMSIPALFFIIIQN